MNKWISITKASKQYNLPTSEIHLLIENREVSYMKLKEVYVDNNELTDYIEQRRICSWSNKMENEFLYYLEDFQNIDPSTDQVKTKRLPHRDSVLYGFIITEIGLLLHREDLRNIFWDVCSLRSM